MLSLIRTQRGRKGIWRTYQYARLGRLEVVTMHGKKGAADIIHIEHVKHLVYRQRFADGEPKRRRAGARS